MEKTVTTVESYGNTAAASIPLTLQKACREGPAEGGGAGDDVRVRGRPVVGSGAPRLVSVRAAAVLITGAGSGIGAGLAAELARAGHHVIVSDLRLADCQAVAAQIRAGGGSAEAVALDVTSDDSVAAALAALSRPGRRAGQQRRPAARRAARGVPDRRSGTS